MEYPLVDEQYEETVYRDLTVALSTWNTVDTLDRYPDQLEKDRELLMRYVGMESTVGDLAAKFYENVKKALAFVADAIKKFYEWVVRMVNKLLGRTDGIAANLDSASGDPVEDEVGKGEGAEDLTKLADSASELDKFLVDANVRQLNDTLASIVDKEMASVKRDKTFALSPETNKDIADAYNKFIARKKVTSTETKGDKVESTYELFVEGRKTTNMVITRKGDEVLTVSVVTVKGKSTGKLFKSLSASALKSSASKFFSATKNNLSKLKEDAEKPPEKLDKALTDAIETIRSVGKDLDANQAKAARDFINKIRTSSDGMFRAHRKGVAIAIEMTSRIADGYEAVRSNLK